MATAESVKAAEKAATRSSAAEDGVTGAGRPHLIIVIELLADVEEVGLDLQRSKGPAGGSQ